METNTTQENIGHWIDRSRHGDRDAFACLVRQYQGMVSGVALSRTGDVHQSEDLAQETFLLAWQKLTELDDAKKFPGWICSIARNLARNAVRKKSERTGTPLDPESETLDPADSLATAEQNALVEAALQKIPERYREPLVLFYRGEQSTKQIADALEITEETARQRLSRARKYLRAEIEKIIGKAIASSGPGEFFSAAVIAALPGALALTSTGKTVAATVVGAESTLAASAMVAGPKSGGGGLPLFGMASGWHAGWYYVSVVVSWCFSILSMFCWVLGAAPGFWFSIRNAPTLRARRFLIRTSLRIHVLFGTVVCFWYVSICGLSQIFHYFYFPLNRDSRFLDQILGFGFYAGLCLLGAAIIFFLIDSPIVYRRIVREDAGLQTPKKSVPLEESFLSFRRLQNSFFRSGIALLVMFLVSGFCLYTWMEITRIRSASTTTYSTGYSDWGIYWCSYLQYYVYFGVVGSLFLIVFRQMHRTFLAMAKDEASFEAAPPLANREAPFGERVLIEWLVSFGFFLIGILAFLQGGIRLISMPQWPVTLLGLLAMTVGGSLLLATISAAAPAFRWLVNLGGFCTILATSAFCFFRTLKAEWGHYPLQEFFESPGAWPVVFGIMILDWIIVLATVLSLVFGGLFLRSRWNGRPTAPNRILSRKTFAIVFCIGMLSIFVMASSAHSRMRYIYYERILMDIGNTETWNSGFENAPKKIEIASAALGWLGDQSRYQINVRQIRAREFFGLGRFLEAIADYDKLISIMSGYPHPERFLPNYHADRGEAKLAIGDARGAIKDFDQVLETQRPEALWGGREYADVFYDRGYAYEKLGETASALADYDEAIRRLEQKPYGGQRNVHSVAVRQGYDDEEHRSKSRFTPGYRISAEELTDIRDRLRQGK